jgi:type IV secretion system protein VirD4
MGIISLISLVAVGVILSGLVLLLKVFKVPTQQLHHAQFATHKDSAPLVTPSPPSDGLLVCQDHRPLFLSVRSRPTKSELGNILVTGKTRSGKGLLATAQLLSWRGSVVVNDIKGDLYTATAGYRSTFSDVYVVDPTGVGHRFDPLGGRGGESDLLDAATAMLHDPQERDGKIFTHRATIMLQCLFQAALMEQIPALPYIRAMTRMGIQATARRMHSLDPSLATRFLFAPLTEVDFDNRFLISAYDTLITRLTPLLTEEVIKSFAGSDLQPAQLMLGERPTTLYIRIPEEKLESLSALTRLLWDSIIAELLTTYDVRAGKGCSPVLLLVDEASRTPIPSLVKYTSTVVGRRIYLWIAIQSLSQLTDKYHDGAHVISENCDTKVFYRPGDFTTAQHLSDRLGKVSAMAYSEHLRDGEQTSEGLAETGIPLMTPQDIMKLPETDVLAFFSGLDPMRMKRADFRQHAELVQRVGLLPPTLPVLPPVPAFDLLIPAEAEDEDSGYIP